MDRCTLVVLDAGSFDDLKAAGCFVLLSKLDIPIVVPDALYDELTEAPAAHDGEASIRDIILSCQPPVVRVPTDVWVTEVERRRSGLKPRSNAGELAVADFLSSDDGLKRYVRTGDPIILVRGNRDLHVANKPGNMHLLSAADLRAMVEKAGPTASADAFVQRPVPGGG